MTTVWSDLSGRMGIVGALGFAGATTLVILVSAIPGTPIAQAPVDAALTDDADAAGPDRGEFGLALDRSLFFRAEDTERIERALIESVAPAAPEPAAEEAPVVEEVIAPPVPVLYLNGVLYLGPRLWTIWLNGERVSGTGRRPDPGVDDRLEVEVVAVRADRADLIWTPSPRHDAVRLTLAPHQSFHLASGRVLEGDRRDPEADREDEGDGQ